MKIKLRDETFRFVQSNTLNPFTVIFFVWAGIMGYLVGVVWIRQDWGPQNKTQLSRLVDS